MNQKLRDDLLKMARDGATRGEQYRLGLAALRELDRLQHYAQFTYFVANDWLELSYEKAQWQRDDWRKRAVKTVAEANKDSEND